MTLDQMSRDRIFVAGDHIYWVDRVQESVEELPRDLVFRVPRRGGPVEPIASPTWVREIVEHGETVYLAGHDVEEESEPPGVAEVFRLEGHTFRPFARMHGDRETFGSRRLVVEGNTLLWIAATGRGHGRGIVVATELPSGRTRALLRCTRDDGHHAVCPDLVRGAPLARDDRRTYLFERGRLRALPDDRCPCGLTPGGYLRGHVLCVPGGRCESDAYVPAMLLPPDGGAPIPIEEAGDSESPKLIGDSIYYHSGERSPVFRRATLIGPEEVLVERAFAAAFGTRAIAWVEGDRLWAAPPPP